MAHYNIEFTKQMLDNLWARRACAKLSWLEFETESASILNSDMSDYDKVRASKELLDAFTRRGHFDAKDYLTDPPKRLDNG